MENKYEMEQREILTKQLDKIYRATKKLMTTRSGGADNYDYFNKEIEPLRTFVIIHEKRKEKEKMEEKKWTR